MSRRHWVLAFGVLTAVGGLAIAFVPTLGRVIDLPTELPVVLGTIAAVAAIVRARAWVDHDEEHYRPIERERPTGIDAPGEEFDALLERAPARATAGNTRAIMIRQSLRETAIETLVTYQGHTEETAREALIRGTWTDDAYAVEFFTSASGTGSSLSETVTSTFYGDGPFHRRAHRAARAIERLARRDP